MKGVALLLLMIGVAFPLVVGYHVEPVKAAWSGWTDTAPGHDRVSQVLTCNWDESDSGSGACVELFVGRLGSNPASPFMVDVYEYPNGVLPVASHGGKPALREHTWLRFPLTVTSGYSFTKGKRHEFRSTWSGSDSAI